MAEDETLLEFPVAFPIKAMGRQSDGFRQSIVETVAAHAEFHAEDDVREQGSANGNFVSITVTFTAENKAQVDAIYQALHDHELVLMVF
jgi:putative lipoic acid-binding regulatory protein